MITAIITVCLTFLFMFLGFMIRWIFNSAMEQIRANQAATAANTTAINNIIEWQRDHLWQHKHRVVEVGSTIDMENEEYAGRPDKSNSVGRIESAKRTNG